MEALMNGLVGSFCLIDDFRKVFEPAWTKGLIANDSGVGDRGIGIDDLGHCVSSDALSAIQGLLFDLRPSLFAAAVPASAPLSTMHGAVAPMRRGVGCIVRVAQRPMRGVFLVDSTPLAVCDNLGIRYQRVFAGYAACSKREVVPEFQTIS
jgi:hypothetical protein